MKGCCGSESAPRDFIMRMMENCCEGEEGMHMGRFVHAGGGVSCCGGFDRRFKTKDEKVAGLEDYLKDLETEAAAVREAIADLRPA